MAKDDFAILVGINRYADSNLPPLDGPLRDVQLVYDWLVDTRSEEHTSELQSPC